VKKILTQFLAKYLSVENRFLNKYKLTKKNKIMITSRIELRNNGTYNLLVSQNGYPRISMIGIPCFLEAKKLETTAFGQLMNMN